MIYDYELRGEKIEKSYCDDDDLTSEMSEMDGLMKVDEGGGMRGMRGLREV